jgi:lysophospholipase L1-like esterase
MKLIKSTVSLFILAFTIILNSTAQNKSSQVLHRFSSEKTLESMDKELGLIKGTKDSTTLWVNAKNLTIEGMGWSTEIEDYTRLPEKYRETVTSNVWNLSRHSSSIHVRFKVKNTSFVSARWTLRRNNSMVHMTSQAVNGLDLYVKQNDKWIFAGPGKPGLSGLKHEALINKGFELNEEVECMLYLPLYNGISSLELGFSPNAEVSKVSPLINKPFVFYGTSILQGCSASRAGMSFVSMLGRKFNTPVVNLGFSGNGLTEAYFGDIMGDIDASIYFIDCLPNMARFSTQEITERTLTLVRKLRILQPRTPIVFVEDRTYTNFKSKPTFNNRRVALKAAYNVLKNEIANLYYVEGDKLLGDDYEATVDGSHPSDLGMYRYFQTLTPVVSGILKK